MSTGGDDDLVIRLKIDNADAMAKQRAVGAAFDRTTAHANASAKAMAKAQSDSAKAQAAAQADASKSQIIAIDRARDAHGKFVAGAKAGIEGVDDASANWLGTLQGLTAGISAFGVGMKVFDYFVNRFEAMRDAIREDIVSTEEYRKTILQLAALKDRLGGTTTETKESLLFRAQTLQSRQSATEFQEAVIGAGESAIKDKAGKGIISREEFDRLMVMAGQFQAAEGGAAETHGTLAGMLPMLMGKEGVTGAEAFQKEQQLYAILKPGGTTFTSGMDQLLKQAPLITSGLYKDVADAASLLSAFSLSNKFGAGENVQQFTRATVGGIGKMRGVKLEGDSEKVGEYLRGLGATTQMDPIEIGKRISADLAREEREATARGEEANLYNYLMYHGYGAQEERMALLGFHGLQKTGQFQNIFEPLAKTPPPIDRARLQIEEFQATDPLALAQKRDVASDLASVSKGVGAPEYYQNLKVLAYERLRARNEAYGKAGLAGLEEWESGWFGWIDGSRQKIVDEARKILEEQGKTVGVTLPRIVTRFSEGAESVETPLDFSVFTSEETRAKAFYEFAGKIGAAGGKPNADLSELVALTKKQIEIAERSEKLMREGLKVPVGPLAPARPGPGWTR